MNTLLKMVNTVVITTILTTLSTPIWAALCCRKHITNTPNISMFFAASPNTAAYEGEKYGKFTEQFLNYMLQPNLTWPQLVDTVKQAVKKSTNGKQVAYLEGDVLSDFVLSAPSNQHKTALVIGNSRYKESPLRNSAQDAKAISLKFQKLGYEVLTITDATHDVMQASVAVFDHKLKNGGVGIVYYSGHRVDIDGENYLVPIDAELENINEMKTALISINSIINELKASDVQTLLFVIDASRNAPFASSR